jgi:hypothetical protein
MTDFYALCAQLRTLKAAGLQDTPSYKRLSDLALQSAPSDVIHHIMTLAVREGRLPQPTGVDAQGQRLWRLEDVAAHFGLSPEETKRSLERFQLEHGDFQSLDPDSINRIH